MHDERRLMRVSRVLERALDRRIPHLIRRPIRGGSRASASAVIPSNYMTNHASVLMTNAAGVQMVL